MKFVHTALCTLLVLAFSGITQPEARAASITSVKDIAYGTASYQKLDLFYNSTLTKRPVMLLVHGRNGKKTDWQPYRGFFTDLGFVVVTPQYNTSGDPQKDVTTAYNWIVSNISRYGGDPKKVNIAGTSEGTYIGSTLTYCRELPFMSFLGLAGIYGGDLIAGPPVEVPTKCADAGDAPAFLVHGMADTKSNYSNSVRFDDALSAAGIESHLYLLPGVGHTDAKGAFFGDPDNQAARNALASFLTRINGVTAPPK